MREARTDAERAAEFESGRPVVWRRLEAAGGRANGLAGLSGEFDPGQAVAKWFAGDVLADVRIGLLTVALAFLWSGDPATVGLGGWIAAAALAIGGLADGGWIAVISLRREVPPWRAVGVVFRESRDAWRAQWAALYGRTLR